MPGENVFGRGLLGILVLLLGGSATGATPPRILLLHSQSRGVASQEEFIARFRADVVSLGGEPAEFHEFSLAPVLISAHPEVETAFLAYLSSLDARQKFDLLVTVGGPATRFVQDHRDHLFRDTPLVIGATDRRHIALDRLLAADTAVLVDIDLRAGVENILRLLPGTKEIVVVLGTSPLERFWRRQFEQDLANLGDRPSLTYVDHLALGEIVRKAASLRPGTVILYGLLTVDAAGVPHQEDAVLAALHRSTAVPIFGFFDFQLGKGIVGGRLIRIAEVSREASRTALRILSGETPAEQLPRVLGPSDPVYDASELARWGIDRSVLPPGSELRFQRPTFWEAYRGRIVAVVALCLAQAGLIVGLLVARGRRRRAEDDLRLSRERYAMAVDGANDGLWDYDLGTGEVYYSPRCKVLLGYREDEGASTLSAWEQRIHPVDRGPALAALRAHLEGGVPEFRVEHRLRHRDGGWRWVLLRGKAHRDPDGRPRRIAGSATDISERKAAEEQFRAMSHRLVVGQEEERARLARELHDDVTQRLAVLAIEAGRLEREREGATPRGSLSRLREGLSRLSEDVHTLSYRLHPSMLEDLGLGPALQAECDRTAESFGVAVDLAVEDLPEHLPADVALCVFRVVQEALRNAGRHARARSVRVRMCEEDGGVSLEVRDDGIGFDTAARQERPTLGQSSMRERVRLLEGRLSVHSVPGEGTTLRAWVPVAEVPA